MDQPPHDRHLDRMSSLVVCSRCRCHSSRSGGGGIPQRVAAVLPRLAKGDPKVWEPLVQASEDVPCLLIDGDVLHPMLEFFAAVPCLLSVQAVIVSLLSAASAVAVPLLVPLQSTLRLLRHSRRVGTNWTILGLTLVRGRIQYRGTARVAVRPTLQQNDPLLCFLLVFCKCYRTV